MRRVGWVSADPTSRMCVLKIMHVHFHTYTHMHTHTNRRNLKIEEWQEKNKALTREREEVRRKHMERKIALNKRQSDERLELKTALITQRERFNAYLPLKEEKLRVYAALEAADAEMDAERRNHQVRRA